MECIYALARVINNFAGIADETGRLCILSRCSLMKRCVRRSDPRSVDGIDLRNFARDIQSDSSHDAFNVESLNICVQISRQQNSRVGVRVQASCISLADYFVHVDKRDGSRVPE